MAHDHGSHTHNHAAGANSRMLAIALGLTTIFLIAELIGAYIFNSLALLSDAAHMFTDSAALAIALAAVKIGQRPADDARTFGYRRFEILAAAFNVSITAGTRHCFQSAPWFCAWSSRKYCSSIGSMCAAMNFWTRPKYS